MKWPKQRTLSLLPKNVRPRNCFLPSWTQYPLLRYGGVAFKHGERCAGCLFYRHLCRRNVASPQYLDTMELYTSKRIRVTSGNDATGALLKKMKEAATVGSDIELPQSVEQIMAWK